MQTASWMKSGEQHNGLVPTKTLLRESIAETSGQVSWLNA